MIAEETNVSARDQVELIKRVCSRRWWLILSVMVLAGVSAGVTASLLSPVYETTTQVRMMREQTIARLESRQSYGREVLKAEAMWFKSRQVLEPVIRELSLDQTTTQAPLEKGIEKAKNVVKELLGRPIMESSHFYDVLEKLRGSAVSVKELRGSEVLEITVQWNDPEVAAKIANTLVDVFIEQFQQFNRGRTRGSRIYLEQQVALARRQLQDAEQAVLDFQIKTGVVAPNNIVQGSMSDTLLLEKRQVEFELAAAQMERENVSSELREMEAGAQGVAQEENELLRKASTNPRSQLRIAMDRVATAEAKVSPARIRQTTSGLTAATRLLQDELLKLGASPDLTPDVLFSIARLQTENRALSSQIGLSQSKLSLLEKEIRQTEADAETAAAELQEYMSLAREQRVTEELYTMLSQRLAAAEVDENTALYDIRVFDPAEQPLNPIKPNPAKMTIIALFMGCMLGISLAFALEYMDDSLRDAGEVETYLGLPVLAEVPKVRFAKRIEHRENSWNFPKSL